MKCACLTLTLCLAAQGQTPAQAPPKGSISGQIVNAKTGAPLKKAGVRLNTVMNANGRGPTAVNLPSPSDPTAQAQLQAALAALQNVQTSLGDNFRGPNVRTVETDDQGRFTFANLDSGKYRLSAERQGFLRQSYGERKYSGGGTPIVVGDGQNIKDLQLRMNPQAVIVGKVLDEDGEPLANVQVHAHRYVYQGGKHVWGQVRTATTSDIGEFRLPTFSPAATWSPRTRAI